MQVCQVCEIIHNLQSGSTEYLVLWDGFSKEDATWEREENITSLAIE